MQRPGDSRGSRRPLISVVTPSFNQAAYLERTIRSVLEQDYPHVEYLVLDGGSTDGSVDIIRRYADRLAYWTSGPDAGQAAAINTGWARASGDILAWLNSDDYYLPGTLAFVADVFAGHPDAPMVYGTCDFVDSDGRPFARVGSLFNARSLRRGHQMIPQPSSFIRRTALERAGPLDESLHYSMDYELFLRIAAVGEPAFVDRPLAAFTVHPDAKTTRDRRLARLETLEVARRNSRGLEKALIWGLAGRARAYHSLPGSIRVRLDRVRHHPVS
jgi:glycosyltransferase involved in cell wall biosynthesis